MILSMMMNYKKTVPSSSDPAFAKESILQTLLPLGFEVVSDTASAISVTGPGYLSQRKSPLLGISYATFDFGRSQITVDAELGWTDRTARMLAVVLIGVGVLDTGILLALWINIEKLHANTWFLYTSALTLLPWIVLAPWIIRWLRRRCEEAMDTLLRNASGQNAST